MIRFLFYLLVFVCGLFIAVLWFGEMRHLRDVAPFGRLPLWTAVIDDRATIARGFATAPLPKLGAKAKVSWELVAPTREGLTWEINADGDGIAMVAVVKLDWLLRDITIATGRGSVSPGQITGQNIDVLLPFQNISGDISLRPREKSGEGQIVVTFDATPEALTQSATILTQLGHLTDNKLEVTLNP